MMQAGHNMNVCKQGGLGMHRYLSYIRSHITIHTSIGYDHSRWCSVLVAYLAPDLAGCRHFPDELLRPFLLALAVRRLFSSPRSSGGSGARAAVLSGGRPAGLLVRESGTAVSARCRSLPFHEPRRAAQRLHSGSLRRHPPPLFLLLPMH